MCTDNFLKEFRRQLYRMHEHYSLDLFADEGIPINTSTTGWYASFGKACLLTNNEKLLDYYDKLGWEDSDIFDDELANMMVDKKILLDEYKHLIFSLIADDDTLFLVAQSELAAIELHGQIVKWVEE